MSGLWVFAQESLPYRPFIDPIPVGEYWLALLVPLVIVVAVVYKTIKTPELARVPGEAARLSATILVFMVLAASGLWLLTEVV